MDAHELLTELKTCDQEFPVLVKTTGGYEEVAEVAPVYIEADRSFAYLLTTDSQPDPVSTDEMDEWLASRGHPTPGQ